MLGIDHGLNGKYYFALLNGLTKMRDASITRALLRTEIFGDKVDSKVADDFITECDKMLQKAAFENLSNADLEKQLAAAGVKSDEDVAAWGKLWKSESAKIHSELVKSTIWNKSFQGVSWRIDVPAANKASVASASSAAGPESKNSDAAAAVGGEPVALVQIKSGFKGAAASAASNSSFLFEVNRSQVKSILAQLEEIESNISKHS